MGVGTVSTYAAFQSTLNDVNTVETNLTKEQEQLSSGNAFQDFAGMAATGQTQQYLSLSDTIARTTQYVENHQTIEASVNTASTVLGQIIKTATDLQSLISQRMSGTSSAGFSTQLQGIWQTLVGQLNTSVNNQYLFSGTATNTPAVKNTFPTLQVPGTPDTGYYQGSGQDMTTRIDDNTVITYNVRADASGFQQLFAGLATAQKGDQGNNTTDLQNAENFVQQGIAQITALQATVGATAGQLTNSDTVLNNQKLYWQGLQQSIGNTDIVSVSTQVAVNQGILQASFAAFAKISALRLSDYLK